MSARFTQAEVDAYRARRAMESGAFVGSATEAPGGCPGGEEKALQDRIEKECRDQGWACVRSRMDKRTTLAPGTPDFIIALPRGITLWVECKTAKGRMTEDQVAWAIKLDRLGHKWEVVRSFNEFLKLAADAMGKAAGSRTKA